MSYFERVVIAAHTKPTDNPLENWDGKRETFPPRQVNNPPKKLTGFYVGHCVFCGGSLGGPYQEDLYHYPECLAE